MGKHLVLAGCGHAHLKVLVNLADLVGKGHKVTLINPSPYHYYSGMGPGMLGGTYTPARVRFDVRKTGEAGGAAFIEAKVKAVDPVRRSVFLDSGQEVGYDAVSFNVGSHIPVPFAVPSGNTVFTVKPIENLLRARREILRSKKKDPLRILIVGGGPAGVEIAGNVWRLAREARRAAEIKLLTRGRVLGGFPGKARDLVLGSFALRGIGVFEDVHIREVAEGGLADAAGTSYPFDFIFLALGIRPSSVLASSGLQVDEDGALLLNRFLQCPVHPEIFGGGDCVNLQDVKLDKVGVFAVRQNPVLLHNLTAFLEGRPLRRFEGTGDYLLVFNLGNGRAVYRKRGLVFDGRITWLWKNLIDTRFMKKFQASGEGRERVPD